MNSCNKNEREQGETLKVRASIKKIILRKIKNFEKKFIQIFYQFVFRMKPITKLRIKLIMSECRDIRSVRYFLKFFHGKTIVTTI